TQSGERSVSTSSSAARIAPVCTPWLPDPTPRCTSGAGMPRSSKKTPDSSGSQCWPVCPMTCSGPAAAAASAPGGSLPTCGRAPTTLRTFTPGSLPRVKIAVVALGKIGLPLAVQFASKGHDVVGVDVATAVVEQVNAGTEPFPGEAHLQERLAEAVAAGRLRATTDYGEAVPGADSVVVVVPLFVDDATWQPDFGWMDAA